MFGSQEEEQQERTERKRDIQSVTDWMSGVIRGEATRTFEVGSLQFEATTTTECLDVQCLDTSQPDARLNRSSYLKISFSPADFEPWLLPVAIKETGGRPTETHFNRRLATLSPPVLWWAFSY